MFRNDDSMWLKIRNVWILWLKVLGLEADQREHGKLEGSSGGDMKSLTLRKEDALVQDKLRRLIRGTVEDSDDSGG